MTNPITPKKAEAFLKQDSLFFLLSKVRENAMLNKHVLPLIDRHLRSGCQVANVTNNQLILLTANASIATSIRFSKNTLLEAFKKNPVLKHLSDIHCIVRPKTSNHLNQQHKDKQNMAPLKQETSQMIVDWAETLDDPKLKEIMLRIASRTD